MCVVSSRVPLLRHRNEGPVFVLSNESCVPLGCMSEISKSVRYRSPIEPKDLVCSFVLCLTKPSTSKESFSTQIRMDGSVFVRLGFVDG